MSELTQADVKRRYFYDPACGHLFHLIGRRKGKQVGYIKHQGYIQVSIGNKKYQEHRLIWLYFNGYLPDLLDHINCCKSDNRIENLRPASHQQNAANRNLTIKNSSGYKGVTQLPNGRYQAQAMVNGTYYYLGVHESPEIAHEAFKKVSKPLNGEFFNGGIK
ncbi:MULTISPECIES: HNH endonuclease [Pantoea]|uniref:HNH endonuclease n=1 Tax=Pantoea TaxID=53335 RepID=UPI0025989D82|nr:MULTISPECIES: HNH endonuclease [Pantoea]